MPRRKEPRAAGEEEGGQATRRPLDFLTQAGFAQLYEATFDAVYRYAYVLTGRAELAADVYVRAWRARDAYRGQGTLLSWLLSITHNCAMRVTQQRSREVLWDGSMGQRAKRTDEPEPAAVRADEAAALRTAIQHLTPPQQHVLVLRFAADMPPAEVAVQTGQTVNAVRATQFRALRRLRTLLESSEKPQ